MVRRHGAEFHGTRVAQLAYLSQTEFAKLSGPAIDYLSVEREPSIAEHGIKCLGARRKLLLF